MFPHSLYCKITCEKMNKSNTKLVSYSGHKIKVMGKNMLPVSHKGNYNPTEFQVIDQPVTPVLGLQTCLDLDIFKRVNTVESQMVESLSHDNQKGQDEVEEILKKYEEVFNATGCLERVYQIKIDHSVTPVIHPPRKVPFTLGEQLKEELGHIDKLGITCKANEPTEWVNSLVLLQNPNGKVRLCLDPGDLLNKTIQGEHCGGSGS